MHEHSTTQLTLYHALMHPSAQQTPSRGQLTDYCTHWAVYCCFFWLVDANFWPISAHLKQNKSCITHDCVIQVKPHHHGDFLFLPIANITE